jgi:iron complex outermembrane receptor protein
MKVIRFLMLALCVTPLLVKDVFASKDVDLNPIVVTATRIGQYDYKLASNVTVLTQKDIKESNAQTVPEILSEALGVNVYNYGTNKSSFVDIRGFGETAPSNVLVLINDRKINSVDLSGPDLMRVPIGSVERIEIIRGAGSVLYGDNAVGGVVNIITKKGKGQATGKVQQTYSSYDSTSTSAEVSGDQKGINYYLFSDYVNNGGYRDNSELLGKDYNARLGYDFFKKVDVDVNTSWHEDKYGLPGALSDTDLDTLGRRGSSSPDDYAKTKDRSMNVTFDVHPWKDEEEYYGNFAVDYLFRNRDAYDSFSCCGNTKRSIDTQGISGKYIYNQTILGKEVNFVSGVDYYDNVNDIAGSNGSTINARVSKADIGVYTFLEYEMFSHLFANAGTRYQRANYRFKDFFNTADVKQRPDNSVSTGGLKYEYAPGSNVHANYQQTFRYLATDEWFSTFTGVLNTDLKQQTGDQYEAGIKHNFKDMVTLEATPYIMNINHEIYFDPRTFSNSNYDKTRRTGVELGSEVDLLKFIGADALNRLRLNTDYTYEDPQFKKGTNEDKQIPMAPHHQSNVRLSAGFLDHYNVSLTGRYVGSRYKISDIVNESSRLKGYGLADFKLSYNRDHYEVFGGVDNVFDKKYIGTAVFVSGFGSFYYPSPARSYNVGMNLKF